MTSASSTGAPMGTCRGGQRGPMGTDDPAMKGTPRARAVSYIHLACSQEYERCLSLKTGTTRPLSRKTAMVSSKKRRRG